MDVLQFSLFFAALLVGYLLIHVRMVRFEHYLREITGIRSLNQRLEAVAGALERVRLDRVEELLNQLHDDLEALQRATSDVEEAVVRLPRPPAAGAVGGSPAERILAVVETRLLQLGFQNLRVLSDLDDLPAQGEVEVMVECERAGMPSKGRVILRNGTVRDVQIQSAAQTFP